MKWMKSTSYNPARVTPDFFHESHGCLNTSLCMLRRQRIPTTTNVVRATNNEYRSLDAWDTQGSYYLTSYKQTPIMCWHGTLNILDQPGGSRTLPNLFRVNRNSPMTLLPLSSLATYTCNGTLPWILTPPEKKTNTPKPKIAPYQIPYLNVPDQSSDNTQLSRQNHLKVKSTGQTNK